MGPRRCAGETSAVYTLANVMKKPFEIPYRSVVSSRAINQHYQRNSYNEDTPKIQSDQMLSTDLQACRYKANQARKPDRLSTAKFPSPRVCQNHSDDGPDVQEGRNKLLRHNYQVITYRLPRASNIDTKPTGNVPANLRFLVWISINFEKANHGLEACNACSVISDHNQCA